MSQYSESVIVVLKNSLGICLNNIPQNTIVCVSLYQTTNIANSSREEWISSAEEEEEEQQPELEKVEEQPLVASK